MKKDLTGQYFGKLLVIKDSGKREQMEVLFGLVAVIVEILLK